MLICVFVCVFLFEHTLLCSWAPKPFKRQELIPSDYNLSWEKGHIRSSTWMDCRRYALTYVGTHTQFFFPFCDFFFPTIPCSHLLWFKITGHYQRSWNQSLSLLIVAALIHYSPAHPTIFNHIPLCFSPHSTLLLSKPYSMLKADKARFSATLTSK